MNIDLYNELVKKRNSLRNASAKTGRKSSVCSDESIIEMVKLMPEKKEEFLNIKGLGDAFVKKYGDAFIKIINKYNKKDINSKILTKDVKKTLKNLENRLVNISKQNRLLYLGKLSPKYAVDMYFKDNGSFNARLENFVYKKLGLVVADTRDSLYKKENEQRYKKISTLIREINNDYRENGEYEMYLGYPFVIGKIKGEDFNVLAPLVLFPIAIHKDSDYIIIKIDETKDIQYNTNLILLHNKFNNENKLPENNTIEEINNNFIENIYNFFKENGITIKGTLPSLEPFTEYTSKNFPHFDGGDFHFLNHFILGKFSLYQSSIQRDFRDISSKNTISPLVYDLLENVDEIDIYDDSEKNTAQLPDNFSESSITYINDLNSSQEDAIRATAIQDELVIEGPPGTGKSQTLTSLIANEVTNGKSILMVSQKKAALDVIYSRLGEASNNALILHDTKDKENFYGQILKLFDNRFPYEDERFNLLSSQIDSDISKLDSISKALNGEINGEKAYKIFDENPVNQFANTEYSELSKYTKNINSNILSCNYNILKESKEKFLNKERLEKLIKYKDIESKYPWLLAIKPNFSTMEKYEFVNNFNNFSDQQNQFLNKNFFKRIFSSFTRKIELKKLIKKYFTKLTYFKYIYKNYTTIVDGFNFYDEFILLSFLFKELNEIDKSYLNAVYLISNLNNSAHIDEVNKIFDYYIFSLIDKFETTNKFALLDIKNYPNIIKQLNNNINKKKNISKEKLKYTLQSEIETYITDSKRYNEIRRIAESKRKWSVNKFMQKFSFELLRGIKIWLMTPESVSEIMPLEEGIFDLVVFDEASQIYIEKGIPSIVRGKKIIITGDHKQLRPSSLGFGHVTYEEDEDDELNAALEEESLLDLARFKYPSVMLNYHYRAKYQELINFSNYAFYKGKLNVAPNHEEPEVPPIEYIKIKNGLWDKRANKNEAIKVVELVKQILNNRKNNETLGVVTFNSSQRDLILDLIDDESAKDSEFNKLITKEINRKNNGEDIGFFVKNIENVQGDERDIIIFSLSYAKNNEGKIIRNFGWLNQLGGENRLNVAISRAKQKIYIITSLEPNELITDDLKNEGPKLFKKYLDYANAVSNHNNELAKTILYSLSKNEKDIDDKSYINNMIKDLSENLINQGYKIANNVGIGIYKFDIAIISDDNKYKLGILCDERAFTSFKSTRERDLSCASFYKARGWEIYRLWSNEWRKNKQKILEDIKLIINKK